MPDSPSIPDIFDDLSTTAQHHIDSIGGEVEDWTARWGPVTEWIHRLQELVTNSSNTELQTLVKEHRRHGRGILSRLMAVSNYSLPYEQQEVKMLWKETMRLGQNLHRGISLLEAFLIVIAND
jgi:hypothetical protein